MANNLSCKSMVRMGFIGLSMSASAVFAEGPPKDSWLSSLKDLAPAAVCKSFMQDSELKKKLKAANISYDKCLTLIPASFDKCKTKYYSQIPDSITKEAAEKWGNNIGMCIGGDFTVDHLLTPQ